MRPSSAVEHVGEELVHPTVGLLVWKRSNTQIFPQYSRFQIFRIVYQEEILHCEGVKALAQVDQ